MPSAILMSLVLTALIVPGFFGHLLTTDDAYSLYYIRDKVVIITLAWLIFKAAFPKKPFIRVVSMLVLVVGILGLLNFIVADGADDTGMFNLVAGKGNE